MKPDESAPRPKPPKSDTGTPFGQMTRERKIRFVLKLVVCILTFGLVFPNIMGD